MSLRTNAHKRISTLCGEILRRANLRSRELPVAQAAGREAVQAVHIERLEDRVLMSASAIERVSIASDGTQGDDYSGYCSISADGRYVAFASCAANLVAGDTNGAWDVFVYDRQTQVTQRVSVASDGTQGTDNSWFPSISADGRFVAFASYATNLVAGDTNSGGDVFVYDRQTQTTQRVSVASDGTQADGRSDSPAISADGRYVAYRSDASNLVAGDTNSTDDVFVYDRQTQATQRVSVASDGTQGNGGGPTAGSGAPAISADGRFVAFESHASNLVAGDTNGYNDIFVYDRQTQTTQRVSVSSAGIQGNGHSFSPAINADGRYVAFESDASTLVAGDTNVTRDVFVYDRQAQTTQRVSVASDGTQGNGNGSWYASFSPSISSDGRYVAFESAASNLVTGDTNDAEDVFVFDRQTQTNHRVSIAADGTQGDDVSDGPAISADGRYVAFESDASNLVAGDTNNQFDVFVAEWMAPTAHGQSVKTDKHVARTIVLAGSDNETPADQLIYTITTQPLHGVVTVNGQAATYTPSGTYNGPDSFAFTVTDAGNGDGPALTSAPATVSLTVYPLADGPSGSTIEFVTDSIAAGGGTSSGHPAISADGRYVAYYSDTADGSDYTADIFVYDRQTRITQHISTVSDGSDGYGGGDWYGDSISADGRYVVFVAWASNLVAGDTNGWNDIFVYDRQTQTTQRITVASDGTQGDGDSWNLSSHAISADGRYVTFGSEASNLVPGDTNGTADVFVYDRLTQTTQRVSVASDGTQGDAGVYGDGSYCPAISADGRYVAFGSDASNLVPGDTNDREDVFVYDRQTHTTQRVSVASDGTEGDDDSFQSNPSISSDGRYVAFESDASNLVADDTNGATDVFVYDRQTHTTQRVSVASDGAESDGNSGSASISADGRYVAFESDGGNLVDDDTNDATDVFVYDRQTHTTKRVSVASDVIDGGDSPSITADGRGVAFCSGAPSDVYVYSINNEPTLTAVGVLAGGAGGADVTISYAALAAAANEADVDGDAISFRIESVTTGTLTKGGSAVVAGTTLLSSGESLVWHPAAGGSGAAMNAFKVKAWDGYAASATAVQVVVDPDTDDAINQATAVAIDSTVTGKAIDVATDVDLFAVTVTAGQRLAFDIDRPSGTLDSFLRLLDSSGTWIAGSNNAPAPGEIAGTDSYFEYTFAAAGTYYLGVSGNGNGSYSIVSGGGDTASGTTGPYTLVVETDPDDQIPEANSIAIGGWTSGKAVDSPTDVDLYAVTVTAGQRLCFDIDRPSGSLDSFIRLFNSAGTKLASSNNAPAPGEVAGTDSYLEYTFALAGTYYLGVSGAGNSSYSIVSGKGDASSLTTGPYTLIVTPDPDPDDTIPSATPVAIGSTISGKAIDTPTDVDLYAVTVTAGQTIAFDIDCPSGGLDSFLRLCNSKGAWIAGSNNAPAPGEAPSTDSYFEYTFTSSGTYYLCVSGNGNSSYSIVSGLGDASSPTTGPYTLVVSLVNGADDTIPTASTVAIGSTVAGKAIEVATDVDLFAFTVAAGQRISFDIDRPGGTLDSYLRMFNGSGTWLAGSNNAPAPGEAPSTDSYFEYTFASAGTYYLGVSAAGNSTYSIVSGLGHASGLSTGLYTLTLTLLT